MAPSPPVYPIVFLDAMHFKLYEDGKVISKAFYSILAINPEGWKDILDRYLSGSGRRAFWLGVLNDLRARGVDDILITHIDGLKGFPEAIAQVFPKAEIQLCVVYQIRHSLKYVVSRGQKEFMENLKQVIKPRAKS